MEEEYRAKQEITVRQKVLSMYTHNSARSRMAEGYLMVGSVD